jgi:hypothetical protein
MRPGTRLSLRLAVAVAFGATAALAVILGGRTPVSNALRAVGSAPTRPAGTVAQCAASGLRISIGPGARLAGAVTRYAVDFTNVSGVPCTLAGYPRVAAYQGNHVQVGDRAAYDQSAAAARVLLSPGQTAHASLDAATATARCRPVRASGLSVVVSAGSGPRYVYRPLTACAGQLVDGQAYLRVRAIQSGAGVA